MRVFKSSSLIVNLLQPIGSLPVVLTSGPRPPGQQSGPGKLLGQACPPQARAWVGGVPLGQL
jgi:hypothetical protein